MSRYFISVPVGPEALTLFNVALLYSSLMCSPFLPLSLSTPSLPEARSLLGGVYAAGPAPPVGLTGARAPSEVIDFNQWLGRLELNDSVDFKRWPAAVLVVFFGGEECCRRRHFSFEGKSDKRTNRIIY